MAWTPDSKSLVFWAGASCTASTWRTRRVTPIPFHVKSTRTVYEALRFPQQVAPERFPVKMLRWVQVSPQGDRVVYQALGHLYVRELPNGTPRRLTKQTEHMELYPSFSRDGRSIVYTTWDDEKLGTIRVVPAGGGEGLVVSAQPGFYVEPAFSPDGRFIVYRAPSGGYLLPALWSRELGLFVIGRRGRQAAAAGEGRRGSRTSARARTGCTTWRWSEGRRRTSGSCAASAWTGAIRARTSRAPR